MAQETTGTSTTTIIRETTYINTYLKLTSMLLNSKIINFGLRQQEFHSRKKSKLGFIDGTKPKPKIASETEEWEVQDIVILPWLLYSMEPNINK
jgi:hypothetical protein